MKKKIVYVFGKKYSQGIVLILEVPLESQNVGEL